MLFGVQRLPKRALGSPRRLPRGTQGALKPQKRDPKMDPKIIYFLTSFGAILGFLVGENWLEKRAKIGPVLDPLGPGSQGSK